MSVDINKEGKDNVSTVKFLPIIYVDRVGKEFLCLQLQMASLCNTSDTRGDVVRGLLWQRRRLRTGAE